MLLNTPSCNNGWDAPDFTLNDAHGGSFTMRDHLGDKGLLIAFICNHCPYVKAIADRLSKDADALLAKGIKVIAIMSNDYQLKPDDSPEKMIEFSKQYNFNFPYLVDEDQSVAKAYDAVCTPDFFGFNAEGKLQYRGRLDDARMEEDASNRVPELLNAMLQVAETGKGPDAQHPSMGCSIKWRK